QFNIADSDQVHSVVKELKPSVVINCAAFNNVDLAQSCPQDALAVNAHGVATLAQICRDQKIFLVHYSTDYVFSGEKKAPYDEKDMPDPINQYGATKLQGEQAVTNLLNDHLLLRVSWVFGQGERNFLFKASQWAQERKELRIADDEVSCPSFVDDIVSTTLLAFSRGLTGLYHANNTGFCSRYAWVKFFFQNAGINNTIVPVSADEFPLPAKRPRFSAMSNQSLSGALRISIPSWQDAVVKFVQTYKD
ncbi:MAG TPA: dTDP-4-dehydrorhamnose reductase, partial [Candidatus Omnitrophota bacterium]|nr:dTDP-4-dehydrorhamnose reductase [Candidatus Omnitrophota bacterium]